MALGDENTWDDELLLSPVIHPAQLPTTQATCEATDLRFYVWEYGINQWVSLGGQIKNGVWQGAAFGCDLSLAAPVPLELHGIYKFGFTARRPGTVPQSVRIVHNFAPH